MTTSKYLKPVTSKTDPRRRLAREQLAAHITRLGLSRWGSGNTLTLLEVAAMLMPNSQVKWHEQQQQSFQNWLAAGGFASADDAPLAVVESGGAADCDGGLKQDLPLSGHAFVG
jgi:hypothetical protein